MSLLPLMMKMEDMVSFELGKMLESKDIATMGWNVVKVMELMQLRKHEKGLMVPDGWKTQASPCTLVWLPKETER
jgi:hypothetical protein